MKVALASIDLLWEQKQGNLELCRSAAQRAAAHGARLVIFPEMTLTGFSMNAAAIAEPAAASPTIDAMSTIARAASCTRVRCGAARPRAAAEFARSGR